MTRLLSELTRFVIRMPRIEIKVASTWLKIREELILWVSMNFTNHVISTSVSHIDNRVSLDYKRVIRISFGRYSPKYGFRAFMITSLSQEGLLSVWNLCDENSNISSYLPNGKTSQNIYRSINQSIFFFSKVCIICHHH